MPNNFNLIDILSNQTARDAKEYTKEYDDYSGLPSVGRQVGVVEREKNPPLFRPTSREERTNLQAYTDSNTYPIRSIERQENLKPSDRDNVWTSLVDQLNVEDRRAMQQSGAEQLANGVIKGVIIAGTTFLDGVVGTAAGIANLAFQAANGDIERPRDALYAFIDNPVSRNLQKINDWAEKVAPNYYSNEQREAAWYEPVNLFSANFVGDKFVKNLGFMLGAAYSGKINANAASKVFAKKELRDAFKGIVVTSASTGEKLTGASEIYKAFKTGDALADGIKMTEHLGKQAKKMLTQEWGLKLLGAASSAAGEARIEAITNTEDYTKRMQQMLDDDRDKTLSQIKDNVIAMNSVENPTYKLVIDPETGRSYPVLTELGNNLANQMASDIQLKYQRACNQLQQDRALMANQIFGLNMFVLTSSNLYTFGRFIAGGYKTGSRASSLVGGSIKKGFNGSKKEVAKDILGAAAVPVVEGPYEEMMQASIARGAGYHASAKMNQFYGYALDEEAQEDAVNSVNAILQGIRDTYSDINNWEEGLVGGLSSIVGIPGFVEVRNDEGITQYEEYKDKNGETRYKPKRKFKLQGEFWENIRDAKNDSKKGKELAEELNKIVKNPEFVERWQSYIRHKDLDKLMKERMDNGDIFGYKNYESDQIISDILAFDKAGRIQDLVDMIDESTNLTEEDGKVIKEQSIDKNTGISPYGDMTDKDVADAVSKHANDFKDILEKYIEVKNNIRQVYGTEMDSKYLDALAWGYMSIDNAEKRIKDISKDLVPKLNDIFHIYSTISGQDLNLKVDNLADLFRFSLNDADKKKFINAINKGGSIKNLSTEKTLSRIAEILKTKDEFLDVLEATKNFGTKEDIKNKEAIHETILNQYLKALNLLNLIDSDPSLHPVSDMEMKSIIEDLTDIGNLILYRSDFLDMLAVLTNDPGAFDKSVTSLNAMMIERNNEKQAQQIYDSITQDMDQKAFNDLLINGVKNKQQLEILEDKLEKSTNENVKRLYKGYDDFINAYESLFNNVKIADDDPLRGLKSALLNNLDNRINEEAASSKDELIQYLQEEAQKLGFQEAMDYANELIAKINVAQERKGSGDDMVKNKETLKNPSKEEKKEEEKKSKQKKDIEKEEQKSGKTFFDESGAVNPEYDRPSGLSSENKEELDDSSNDKLLNAEEIISKLPVQDLVSIVEDNLIPESLLGEIEISKIVELAKYYLEEAGNEDLSETSLNDVINYKDESENKSASPEQVVRGKKVFEYPEGTLLNGLGVTKYDINKLNEFNQLQRYNSELGDILDTEFNVYGFLDSGGLAAIEKYKIENNDRTKLHFVFANKNSGSKYEGKLHTIQNEGQDNQRDNYNVLLAVELTDDVINSLSSEQKEQMRPVIIGKNKYQVVGTLSQIRNSQESKNAYNTVYAKCIESIDRQRESSGTSEQDLFIGDSNGKEVYTTIARIYTGRLQKINPGDKYKPIKELLDSRYQKDIYYGVAIKSKKFGTTTIVTVDKQKPYKNPEEIGVPAVPGMVYAFIKAPDGSITYVPIVMARSNEIDWYADNSFVNPIRQNVETLLSETATSDQKFQAKIDIMHEFGQPFQLYYRIENPKSFKMAGDVIESYDDFVNTITKPSVALRIQFGRDTPMNPTRIEKLVDNDLMLTRYQSLQHYNSSFLVWGLDSVTGESKNVKQVNISEIRNNPVKDNIVYVVQYGNKQYHINEDNEIVDDNNEVVDNNLAKRLLVQLSVAHAEDKEDFGLNIKRESGKTMMLYTIEGAADGSFKTFYMARNIKSRVVKEITEVDAKALHDIIERENEVEKARETIAEAERNGFDISHNIEDKRIPATPPQLSDDDFSHSTPKQKEEEEPPREKKSKRSRKQSYVTNTIDIDAISGEDPTDEDLALLPFIRKYNKEDMQNYLIARGQNIPFNFNEVNDIIIAQALNRIFNSDAPNKVTKDELENAVKCGKYGK